jgi:AmmeMemoRadiSam system protein B/AmmeMemoRadiSam system protein A
MSSQIPSFSADEHIRYAAVAGQFYSDNKDILRKEVSTYLADGKVLDTYPKLLISPHAGYVFSGSLAGKGIATIDKKVKRVFVIGPSHYKYFQGISFSSASAYETPLGIVNVDRSIIDKIKCDPLVADASDAEGPEHCLEVQIPFLQVHLESFSIIPMIVGKVEPSKVADLLFPFIDNETVLIASSDLSHYHPQKEARILDDKSVATVMEGNVGGFIDGCGEIPIRIIMHLAKKLNVIPVKIDSRTSFETAPQYGSQNRVVGYAAIAFIPEGKKALPVMNKKGSGMTEEIQKWLLQLARENLIAAVHKKELTLPENIPEYAKENRGCFVTLTINGNLRGCIGYIEPIKPLVQAVAENARNASMRDPRFAKVNENELGMIAIELSVLTVPVPLEFESPKELLEKLRPGIDGVILENGPYQSTFLPQVWEQLPDRVMFLEYLSRKAGVDSDGWKQSKVKIYQAEHFEEQ